MCDLQLQKPHISYQVCLVQSRRNQHLFRLLVEDWIFVTDKKDNGNWKSSFQLDQITKEITKESQLRVPVWEHSQKCFFFFAMLQQIIFDHPFSYKSSFLSLSDIGEGAAIQETSATHPPLECVGVIACFFGSWLVTSTEAEDWAIWCNAYCCG